MGRRRRSTDYDNGIAICGTHHRALHEGGWKIRGNPERELTFISPEGKELTGRPPTVNTKTKDALQLTAFASVDRVRGEREAFQAQRDAEIDEFNKRLEADLEQQRQAWATEQAKREREREELERLQASQPGWGDPAA
jgi:hypothetical protein